MGGQEVQKLEELVSIVPLSRERNEIQERAGGREEKASDISRPWTGLSNPLEGCGAI